MNRIDAKFRELKKAGRKAFITFITAGYPSLSLTKKLLFELEAKGADIIELGVPFSDPLADGPVIQRSSSSALKRGTRLIDVLRLVKQARRNSCVPICLMTYFNPVFCFGEKEFVDKACECGVDGVIIPDLPPEEAKDFLRYAAKRGLAVICFLAPTSSLKRIKYIAKLSKGFIYYVSLTGVTGARKKLSGNLRKNLSLIKKYTRKPLCVGFGISTPGQVKQAGKVSDGVIIGSAIMNKIEQNLGCRDLVRRVGNFIGYLNV